MEGLRNVKDHWFSICIIYHTWILNEIFNDRICEYKFNPNFSSWNFIWIKVNKFRKKVQCVCTMDRIETGFPRVV